MFLAPVNMSTVPLSLLFSTGHDQKEKEDSQKVSAASSQRNSFFSSKQTERSRESIILGVWMIEYMSFF